LNFRVGFHVSIAGGIQNSVSNAVNIGCTAFQIFTRSPRGWAERKLIDNEIESFRDNLKKSGIQKNSVTVHMPYLPNLSGPDNEIYEKSKISFKNELIRCSRLGIEYLVIHLGSHRGMGKDNGTKQLLKSCEEAVDNYKSTFKKKLNVTILLENSAGQKDSIGSTLEELAGILEKLPRNGYGMCLDTCHAFASGYDLKTADACNKFIDKFDKILGLEVLKFIHMNDSKGDIGSHLDRHEHIGLGKIGIDGLKSILNMKSLKDLPVIMETPIDSTRDNSKNLQVVLHLRK
jgi:deoxyribonuclease IV